jgi:type IV secretory pathway VirB10-like protein
MKIKHALSHIFLMLVCFGLSSMVVLLRGNGQQASAQPTQTEKSKTPPAPVPAPSAKPTPAPPPPAPVPLTPEEATALALNKEKIENVRLTYQILQTEYAQLTAKFAAAHNLDLSKWRLDPNLGRFVPEGPK